MADIAMENPRTKWRFIAGKIIYKWAMASMAMLNNQRVDVVFRGKKTYHWKLCWVISRITWKFVLPTADVKRGPSQPMHYVHQVGNGCCTNTAPPSSNCIYGGFHGGQTRAAPTRISRKKSRPKSAFVAWSIQRCQSQPHQPLFFFKLGV